MKMILLFICFFCFINSHAQKIEAWKVNNINEFISAHENDINIINFWATFCKPCVEELPYFIKISQKASSQKINLILVSLDTKVEYQKKITSLINKQHYISNFKWLDETNADYFCPIIDSNWSGSIPATLIINKQKGFKKFIESSLTEEELSNYIKAATL